MRTTSPPVLTARVYIRLDSSQHEQVSSEGSAGDWLGGERKVPVVAIVLRDPFNVPSSCRNGHEFLCGLKYKVYLCG